jgi:hypothetical protein
VITNRCEPLATLTVVGDEQLTGAAPSSEHVVLETVPVVVHAKRAVDVNVYTPGAPVIVIVGRVLVVTDVTVHVYEADALPAEFATVTLKACVPTASPL